MHIEKGTSRTQGAGNIKWAALHKGQDKHPFPIYDALFTIGVSNKVLFRIQNTDLDFIGHVLFFVLQFNKPKGKHLKYHQYCERNDY